jgi:hypothetical protein
LGVAVLGWQGSCLEASSDKGGHRDERRMRRALMLDRSLEGSMGTASLFEWSPFWGGQSLEVPSRPADRRSIADPPGAEA